MRVNRGNRVKTSILLETFGADPSGTDYDGRSAAHLAAAKLLGGKLLIWADWRAIFWCLAAIGMVCLAAVIWRMPETHKAEHIQSLHLGRIVRTYCMLLGDMRFLAYALIGGLALGGMFAYIAGSPFVFIYIFGMAPDDYAVIFGLNAFGLSPWPRSTAA